MKPGYFIWRLINHFLSLLMMTLVLLIFVVVVLRWFGLTLFWYEEISKLLFVWIIFIGSIEVFRKNKHIASSILFDRFSNKTKRIIDVIDNYLIFILLVVLVVASAKLFLLQFETKTSALMMSYSVFSISALISFSAMLVILVERFITSFIKKRKQLAGKEKFII